jgi:GTPase SAR1 family protein
MIMLGDGAVGKTSLLKMYAEGTFSQSHMATLGLDYVTKNYSPADSTTGGAMQVKLWDTAG